MAEYNPTPDIKMNDPNDGQKETSATTSGENNNNDKINEATKESAAAVEVMKDPHDIGYRAEDLENWEALMAGTFESKINIDNAIRYIMDKNTADFKDFHFSSNIQDIIFNRMQQTIYTRIKALKADRGHDDVRSIIKAYRGHHSKADDIKYLTSSFYEMELLSHENIAVNTEEKASCNVQEKPNDRTPVTSPQELEMEIDSEVIRVQKDRSKMRRLNSGKGVVKFKNTEDVCEYWAEPDQTDDD